MAGLSCSFASPINNEGDNNAVSTLENTEINLGELNQDLDFDIRSLTKTDLGTSLEVYLDFSDSANLDNNYYVGYWGDDGYYPASLQYSVRTSDGDVEIRSSELIPVSTLNDFDGLGYALGRDNLRTYCDIPLAAGEEVLYEEDIYLFNVFYYDSETRTADFENPYYSIATIDRLIAQYYPAVFDGRDFIEITYLGSSQFSNYSAFQFNVENYSTDLYGTFSATAARNLEQYADQLANGTYYIRTLLAFGGATQFDVTLNDDTHVIVNSIAKNYEITHGGVVTLLFEGIDASEVKNININRINITSSIYSVPSGRDMALTSITHRFGSLYTNMTPLYDSNGTLVENPGNNHFFLNYDLIVIVIFVSTTAIFYGITLFLYFYWKRKYRNDEFRRMNTRLYFQTNTLGYVCLESIILALTFIFIRWSTFNNSLDVYNPSDVYIIVFGVISIVLGGYFIKYFVTAIKNNIEKKKRDRLKINQDVIDDGTLIIRK